MHATRTASLSKALISILSALTPWSTSASDLLSESSSPIRRPATSAAVLRHAVEFDPAHLARKGRCRPQASSSMLGNRVRLSLCEPHLRSREALAARPSPFGARRGGVGKYLLRVIQVAAKVPPDAWRPAQCKKPARYELILKLCTRSFIRCGGRRRPQQHSGSHIRYISPQNIQYFSQATLIGTALNRPGTPSSDTNITQIIETVSTSAACGLRI